MDIPLSVVHDQSLNEPAISASRSWKAARFAERILLVRCPTALQRLDASLHPHDLWWLTGGCFEAGSLVAAETFRWCVGGPSRTCKLTMHVLDEEAVGEQDRIEMVGKSERASLPYVCCNFCKLGLGSGNPRTTNLVRCFVHTACESHTVRCVKGLVVPVKRSTLPARCCPS